MKTDSDGFCPECAVSLDLHPDEQPGRWECTVAQQKADLLDHFPFRVGARSISGNG